MRKIFWAFVFMGLLASCANNKEIVISGTVQNLDGQTLLYYTSVGGMFDAQLGDTLQIQADSTFILRLPASEYERVRFTLWGKGHLGTLILKDGKVQVDLDGSADTGMNVSGVSESKLRVARMLSQLEKDVSAQRRGNGDLWDTIKDTVPSSVAQKLRVTAEKMELQLEGVDKELVSKARQDIRMQIFSVFLDNAFEAISDPSGFTTQEWIKEIDQMLDFVQIDHPDNSFSPAFLDVIMNLAGYRYYLKGVDLPEGIKEGPELFFYDFEHHLAGKNQEAAMAQLILRDELEEQYDPSIITLTERFYELYPNSPWRSKVDEALAKNKAINEIEIPDYIHFPDIEHVKTLKGVTDMYKGKVIFLDIWATWCGPCRASFAYVKPLQEYAKEHDVVLLYLSLDNPEDEELWRKMVAHHDLMGEHIRIQKAFETEIYTTFCHDDGLMHIPHYAILDRGGEIRYQSASSPEEMDKLITELEVAAK
ncbi:TlpA disulfide reductase family protein [Porphyromonadaceae bacterium W3.11]|nr:TlpA disulfide reductase family protein [Porphyromonadaceae bacterium W3.11]